MKNKSGRPKTDNKKSVIIQIAVSKSEADYLKNACSGGGYKFLSPFLRMLVLDNASKIKPISPHFVILIGNLRKIGANINQISHALNKANLGYIKLNNEQLIDFNNQLSEYLFTIKSILNLLENES